MMGERKGGRQAGVCVCFGGVDFYSTRVYFVGQRLWIVFSILVTCKTFIDVEK